MGGSNLPLILVGMRALRSNPLRASDGPDREAVLSMSLAKRMASANADSVLLGKTILADGTRYKVVGILDGDRHLIVATSQARVDQVAKGMLVFKLGLGAIAAISLVVGGIGIMNVLLASVAERTREIGVRKATGARKSDILVQFLAESVSITGFGAVIGTLLGMVASAGIMIGIKTFTGAPVGVTYTWLSIVLATVAATVIGIVFGLFPALRASHLSPVDAIRHE